MNTENQMPTTRERIIALVKEEPHLNQTEIAEHVGVKRQRVSQIIADEGLSVPRAKRGVASRKLAAEDSRAPSSDAVPAHLAAAGRMVGVLVAAADMMVRGFTVFLPVTQTAACDFLAMDSRGQIERVSVRKARRAGEEIRDDDPIRGGTDRRALILTDEPVRYEPVLGRSAHGRAP
jgi:hypothetical protein